MGAVGVRRSESTSKGSSFASPRVCLCRRECEFEDDCDSLAWEETEETLLLWEDFPGYTLGVETQGEVYKNTHKQGFFFLSFLLFHNL